MKRILISLLTIVALVGVGVGVTRAYFTATASKTGNTFSTGTIDIDPQWGSVSVGFTLPDMKPSQTGYINFVIHNTGTNPANVYKSLTNFITTSIAMNESKCIAIGGSWDGTDCPNGTIPTDLQNRINYDLRVELYNQNPTNTGAQKVWWETIYMDSDNKKLNTLTDPTYLGMIPTGWYLKVVQSYHLVPSAEANEDNKYQGDNLTFNIVLDAEQLGARDLVLENKEMVNGELAHTILGDGKYATLSYKVKEDTFDYTVKVFGWTNGNYTLISYKDPWPGTGSLALANVTVSGGVADVTGSIDLNQDLINAKMWLVQETFTPGTTISGLTWNPTNTLFETGLMDYYDPIK